MPHNSEFLNEQKIRSARAFYIFGTLLSRPLQI